MMNEADTTTKLVRPRVVAAGWDAAPQVFREQFAFTAGRIVTPNGKPHRLERKVADFVLDYRRDLPLAVLEVKGEGHPAGDGMQQAKEYAAILGLKFAYATNGHTILEFDEFTQLETERADLPTPTELWHRYRAGRQLGESAARALLIPYQLDAKKVPRYYQQIAITRAVEAVLAGQKRLLLTLATGSGKTVVAFQVAWKLWKAYWTAAGVPGRQPRILFLADRTVLVDGPCAKDFAPFGAARCKLQGEAVKSREMYFALYQALGGDGTAPGLYTQFPPDFFDLVIIDECHRGSASAESSWRAILDYFAPATQLGMTATPLRDDNRDTYDYFGAPLYTYSLRQGIDDGFLAPYRVHRVVTTPDAAGWRPMKGQLDKYGQLIPDDLYLTKDFERTVSLTARTEAIARHLSDHLRRTDRYGKTIVFCVDQEHADQMRRALHNLNLDLAQEAKAEGSEYVARVTSDEGDIGRGFLGQFQDVDTRFPVVLTTSQLLTTGVDAETVKNVALVRVVGSMSEFKQIIGRGTRVKEDCGKLFFHILDYTGSAVQKFADPEFDGDPVAVDTEDLDGNAADADTAAEVAESGGSADPLAVSEKRRKFYVHGGPVTVDTEVTTDLDPAGLRLRTVQVTSYAGEVVRTLYADPAALKREWATTDRRNEILAMLKEREIDFAVLAALAGEPDADPLDVLCHVAFNAPVLTRTERAEQLRATKPDFFAQFGPDARGVLDDLLAQYAEHGAREFDLTQSLALPRLAKRGTPTEIMRAFGGGAKLADAVRRMQELLYAD